MAEKKTSVDDVIKSLEDFFGKTPDLPTNFREVLVKIAPWLALIFGILGVIAGLSAIGLSPVAMLGGVNNSMMVLLSGVLSIVSSVLLLVAYPGLRARKLVGWRWLFWSEAVSILSSLVVGAIVGAIIGFLIGFYLLFQIKSFYK